MGSFRLKGLVKINQIIKTHKMNRLKLSNTETFMIMNQKNHYHERVRFSFDENGNKILYCDFEGCNKWYRSKDSLNRHKKSHDPMRLHKCDYCDKTTHRIDHLKQHMKHAHVTVDQKDKSLYYCEYNCGKKGFSRKDTRKRHYEDKNGHTACPIVKKLKQEHGYVPNPNHPTTQMQIREIKAAEKRGAELMAIKFDINTQTRPTIEGHASDEEILKLENLFPPTENNPDNNTVIDVDNYQFKPQSNLTQDSGISSPPEIEFYNHHGLKPLDYPQPNCVPKGPIDTIEFVKVQEKIVSDETDKNE